MSTTTRVNTDDTPRTLLRRWARYPDLVDAGLVNNWTQLLRLIDYEGFPTGAMLSPNVRAWPVDEIESWLAGRPTARKSVPPDAVHPRISKRRADAAQTPSARQSVATEARRRE
jgi:hypothetical protein